MSLDEDLVVPSIGLAGLSIDQALAVPSIGLAGLSIYKVLAVPSIGSTGSSSTRLYISLEASNVLPEILGASCRNIYEPCLLRFYGRHTTTQTGTHRKSIQFNTTWRILHCIVMSLLLYRGAVLRDSPSLYISPIHIPNITEVGYSIALIWLHASINFSSPT